MQWTTPVCGSVKLNSDASYMPDSSQGWAGAVARDHRGLVLLSICKALPQVASAEDTEGRAALVGLHALANVYRGPVELESDCKSLVDALNADVINRSPSYGLLLDIKAALSAFSENKVIFAARECNLLAHELAAEARMNGDSLINADVPEKFRHLVLTECTPA